jgi:IS30 family transposase
MAKRRYAEARSKPQLREEELAALDALITPLIKKGQPLTHIYAEHGGELPVSQRTLYHYIDAGNLSVGNLDLRRKVGYRPRRKKKKPSDAFSNQKYRQDRAYEDFITYMAHHPKAAYVEMDTVKGVREQGKRMLTMLFVEQNLMLIFLMRDGKAETVVEQLDWLTAALGLETFRTLFPVILTDNGSEFKRTREMEYTVDGKRRTHLFYCDPQASWQKPHIEKNHEYIRYVLPRGKSFNPYTQEDILLLLNHINSTRRSKLDGKTPFELATGPAFQQLKAVMGLQEIPADEVDLTPRLLKKK